MSSVSSVGSGNDLLTYLQQLAAQQAQQSQQTSNTSPTSQTNATQDVDGDTTGSSTTAVTGSGGGHHHGGGHHPKISSQLQDAITSALSSSDPGSDPNSVIQSAIENFLNPTGTNTDPTTANGSQPLTVTDPTNQQSSFAQVLQSNGVDPEQFQQDLLTALQDSQSQGGSVDFSQVFKNFPPGSTIDTMA